MSFGRTDLARFFWRARPVRLAALLVVVAGLVLFAAVIALESLQSSGVQLASESLGDSTAGIEFSGAAPLGKGTAAIDRRTVVAAARAGARDVQIGYSVSRLRPDGAVERPVEYSENDWTARPFPQQRLRQGAWPSATNEAAVSPSMAGRWPLGSTIRFFGGALRLRVVGVVFDDLGRDDDVVYTAPGTWDSLTRIPAHAAELFAAAATRQVRWRGAADPARITEVLTQQPGVVGPSGSQGTQTQTRQSIEAASPRNYIELQAATVLAPLVAGLAGGVVASRFTARVRRTLWTLGLTWTRTRAAALNAVLGSTAIASIVGIGLGIGTGMALRPLLDATASTALGPVHDLAPLAVTFVCCSLVGAGLGAVIARSRADRRTSTRAGGAAAVPLYLLCIPATILAVLGDLLVQGTSSVTQLLLGAFCFGAAVVMLSPVLLLGIGRLSPVSMPLLLAVRRIAAERRSTSWIVVGAAGLILLSFGATTFYTSGVAAANAQNTALLPHHEIELAPNDRAAAPTVRHRFEAALRLGDPVTVRAIDGSTGLGDGSTLAVDDPHDLQRLLQHPLTATQVALLTRGGTLRTHHDDRATVTITPATGSAVTVPASTMNGLDSSFQTYDGFILTAAAHRDHLALVQPVWIYTGVSSPTERAAKATAQRLGFTPAWVVVNETPDAYAEPFKPILIAGAIALLAGLLLMLVAAAEARALRPVLAGLRAVGVDSAWLARAVFTRAIATTALALLVAAVGGAIGVGLALSMNHLPFGVTVPWLALGSAVVITVALTLIGVAAATRNLRASERLV